MMGWKEDLQRIWALYEKYSKAPRKGWVIPGSRTMANQTIEISKKEAVDLALELYQTKSTNRLMIFQIVNLERAMSAIAHRLSRTTGAELRYCPKCIAHYLDDWADGKCPYCAAREAAEAKLKEVET